MYIAVEMEKPEEMEKLETRGQYLLQSGQWADCQFLVGESTSSEVIQAHKLYLAASSSVFSTMFYGSIPEEIQPIKVPDVAAKVFKLMLKYIYTNQLKLIDIDEAKDLYYCAKKYMMPALAKQCSDYIRSVLSIERICKIYEFAVLYEEPQLLIDCINLIRTRTREILTHPNWKDAPETTVSFLFEQNILNLDSEIDLYRALVLWSRAECERKFGCTNKESMRKVSDNFITKIRFLTLTAEQFAAGPGDTEILTEKEVLAILMNILHVKVDMPEGFDVATAPRRQSNSNQQVSVIFHGATLCFK